MNRAQRIVLVIALGIGMIAIAIAANLVMTDPLDPSWFDLSEGPRRSDDYFVVMSDRAILEQVGIWLLAVATWAGAALAAPLGPRPPRGQ
jgi:hypothetical protein